jgi:hypothetical protein
VFGNLSHEHVAMLAHENPTRHPRTVPAAD